MEIAVRGGTLCQHIQPSSLLRHRVPDTNIYLCITAMDSMEGAILVGIYSYLKQLHSNSIA